MKAKKFDKQLSSCVKNINIKMRHLVKTMKLILLNRKLSI